MRVDADDSILRVTSCDDYSLRRTILFQFCSCSCGLDGSCGVKLSVMLSKPRKNKKKKEIKRKKENTVVLLLISTGIHQ